MTSPALDSKVALITGGSGDIGGAINELGCSPAEDDDCADAAADCSKWPREFGRGPWGPNTPASIIIVLSASSSALKSFAGPAEPFLSSHKYSRSSTS